MKRNSRAPPTFSKASITAMAWSKLPRFELEGVRDTGREVGHGSYAVVKELEFRGLKCVGKKIHSILFDSATPQEQAAMLERFAAESELLGELYHPCIVQFLGVWFEQDSRLPVLVMEYLHSTLSACLERYGVLPEKFSYRILRDVALGLRYLHERSPPVIQRDLSANNVLLTSNMNAKISDLGVAKILDLTTTRMTQMTQTRAPGTPCYMPPEAMVARPKYTSKVDIFSYGVLIVHVLSGEWPIPGVAFTIDPLNSDAVVPVTEFDRRKVFIQKINYNSDNLLVNLIRQCLSNMPSQRPEAAEIVSAIATKRLPAIPNIVELLRNATVTTSENKSLKSENDSLRSENLSLRQEKEAEKQSMMSEIQSLKSENDSLRSENLSLRQEKEAEKQSTMSEIQSLRSKVDSLQLQIKRLSISDPDQLLGQPELEFSQAKLRWKRCADLPVAMVSGCAVVIGKMVYVGGGASQKIEDRPLVFRYDPSSDEWSRLPPHHATLFAMAEFAGNLITVGGVLPGVGPTGKVYTFKASFQRWVEFLKPMPTARYHLSVATTQSTIIASGGCFRFKGCTDSKPCAIVEVYNSETAEWHSADPLPVSCWAASSTTLADNYYMLGGHGTEHTVLHASLTSLIQKATSPTHLPTSPLTPVWKTLPDTPLMGSTAASLSGNLLAVGGFEMHSSPAVHVFLPHTNSWAKICDLPEPRYFSTVVGLSSDELLVIAGCTSGRFQMKSVLMVVSSIVE